MERQSAEPSGGDEVFHYVDSPADTTQVLVERIYRLLDKKQRHIRLPLALASTLAVFGDIASAVTRIDFPITSARVRKFRRSTNFSAERIRSLGFEQRVTNEEAVRRTVEWYLRNFARPGGMSIPREQTS